MYPEDECRLLCFYWIHKNNYFFNLWGKRKNYIFTEEDIRGYEEPQWVRDGLAAAVKKATGTRAAQIRRLRPKPPKNNKKKPTVPAQKEVFRHV